MLLMLLRATGMHLVTHHGVCSGTLEMARSSWQIYECQKLVEFYIHFYFHFTQTAYGRVSLISYDFFFVNDNMITFVRLDIFHNYLINVAMQTVPLIHIFTLLPH